jgi:hypothetical protein
MIIYVAVDTDRKPVLLNESLDKLVEELDKYNGVHMCQAKRIKDDDNLNPDGYVGELERLITYECIINANEKYIEDYRIYNLELNEVIE